VQQHNFSRKAQPFWHGSVSSDKLDTPAVLENLLEYPIAAQNGGNMDSGNALRKDVASSIYGED